MKTSTFVVLFAVFMGLYLFGDYLSVFGVVPASGSTLSAILKGCLMAAAIWVLFIQLRSAMKIAHGFALLITVVAGCAAFMFEARKDQRLGRKILAKYLDPDVADGAWIHVNQPGQWMDPTMIVGFSQPTLAKKTSISNMRKIPYCNISFPNADRLLSNIPEDQLGKTHFFWNMEQSTEKQKGVYYKVLAIMPEGESWFYRSGLIEEKKTPIAENIENARQFLENGAYVDRDCAKAPYTFHKKQYTARNVIQTEWDEKNDSEKLNEALYDSNGRAFSGRYDDVFMYFVDASEAGQKGFGKAGMLKCVGFYTYRDGKKNGPYEFYYPGYIAKAFVGNYENGHRVGLQKQFNPNGTLKKSWDESSNKEASSATLVR